MITGFQLLVIFSKKLYSDVWQGSEYASAPILTYSVHKLEYT